MRGSGGRRLAIAFVWWLPGLGLAFAPNAVYAQTRAPGGTAPATRVSSETRAITMVEAWNEARRRSPRIEAAGAAVARADAAAQIARAAWLPSLRAQAIYTRLDDERALGERVLTPRDATNAALVLTVPLIDVTRWRQSRVAKAEAGVERDRARDTERRLAQEVGARFLGVLLERRALEVIERAVATSRTQLEIARARRAEGVGTRLEEVRAERELRDNQGRAALGRASVAAAQEALGAVTGAGQPLDAVGEVVLPVLPAVTAALADLRARADLAALARDVALLEADVSDAWTEYLPTFGLTAQPFLQRPATPNLPAYGWQAQLALVLPIYDGGSRPAAHRERRARLVEARAAFALALIDAEAEIRAGLRTLSHRDEALVETAASATLADESLELARAAFQEGAGTQVDLIEAERAARDAATAVALATHDRDRARLALLLAIGRSPFAE